MKLSEKAWTTSAKLIEAIKQHPFNQELKNGTSGMMRITKQFLIVLQTTSSCF